MSIKTLLVKAVLETESLYFSHSLLLKEVWLLILTVQVPLPWSLPVTILVSSLLVSWTFFLGSDEPPGNGKVLHTEHSRLEALVCPWRRASLNQTAKDTRLGHCLSIVYAGIMWPGREQYDVDLSPVTMLNVIHTRTKSLDWKWYLFFYLLSVYFPLCFPTGWEVERYCVQLISQHFYSFVVYFFCISNSA